VNVVDLLVTIVVVTILVTIVLAVVTYVAYKLRLAREPSGPDVPEATRYFVLFEPEARVSVPADAPTPAHASEA
jgi:heme/copper-type cytochrome/quinol oxidase subunit 2